MTSATQFHMVIPMWYSQIIPVGIWSVMDGSPEDWIGKQSVTLKPLLKRELPLQENLLQTEFVDFISKGGWQKVTHLNKLYLRHVKICKNIKCTIRLSNAKCIIPCGHPFRLKCEMWSWGGQICRRWKSSLFISVLLINLNTAVHLADTETLFPASHRLFSTLGGCISISGVSTDFSDGERLNHRNRRFFFMCYHALSFLKFIAKLIFLHQHLFLGVFRY